MKSVHLWTIVLVLSATISNAQESVQSDFTIGTNIASLVQSNSFPSLLLDYNFTTNNHVRLQVGYSNSSGNLETDIQSTQTQNNGLNGDTLITNSPYSRNFYNIQLGYYRTTKIDEKFNIYFGLDFVYRQTNNRTELNLKTKREFSVNQAQFFDTREKVKTNISSFGVAPMFGILYQLGERINLGFEIHSLVLSTSYLETINRKTVQSSSFDPRLFETEQKGTRGWNEVTNSFNPMSGLFISYRL